jgi:ribose transport system substrate-binding protein
MMGNGRDQGRRVKAHGPSLWSVGLVCLAFIVVACGEGGSEVTTTTAGSNGSTTTEAGDLSTTQAAAEDVPTFLSEAQAALELGYAGDFQDPPTEGPTAVGDKDVWVISCGQAFEACAVMVEAFQEAGDLLGWTVTVQDGAADPTVAATIIRQAIAAQVDGIAVAFFDCPGVKSALLEARDAAIPVVTYGSLDCDNPIYGGTDEPLYTAPLHWRGSTDTAEYYAAWARARANYVIATSEGSANVLSVYENSQAIQQANGAAFLDEMGKCTTCALTEVPFSFAQVPEPATLQWQSAITANPEATVIANGIDALMNLGLQTAIQQSGRSDLVIDGAEGNPSNMDYIRQGTQRSATAMPYEWIFWALADSLNRIFAGEDPASLPNQGGGWQFIDAEHNLPAEGERYAPPVDFKTTYSAIWEG